MNDTSMRLTNLSRISVALAILTASLAIGAAAPLRRADVPADPAWVLHVDCDGLRPNAIGQYLLAEMEKPDIQAKFAAFQAIFSFDPRKQLHGFTLYSAGIQPEEGVLLIYADFDAERLLTLVKATQDYQAAAHRKYTIHNWIDEKKEARNGVRPRVYAATYGGRIILGQRLDCVAKALDVLDGAKPSLASGSTFPQLGAPGDTHFLEGAARKLDLSDSDPGAAIFRLSKTILLQLGENRGQATATLTLEASGDEMATTMTTIAQGLVALLKLQTQKPEVTKLAEAIVLSQDGPRVVARLTLPSNAVVDLMKADAARKAAKQAETAPK